MEKTLLASAVALAMMSGASAAAVGSTVTFDRVAPACTNREDSKAAGQRPYARQSFLSVCRSRLEAGGQGRA